ncbi:MAG: hypothetical protein IR160_05675 [Salinibacterium sp.]|nr:hypothetical protein [Salinibacterium sp.]MBF0672059.1 hypothetical protein [Salinibacterium sp.]
MKAAARARIVVLLLACALVAAVQIPATDATAATYTGANSVAIPYEGEAQVKPAEHWAFTDCAAALAASDLVTACEAQSVTFAAPVYDPDFGTVVVPLALGNGAVQLTVDYIVTLAPPPVPVLPDQAYGYPFAAGTRVMLPFSDLDIECQVCTGMTVTVDSVAPREAGIGWATATHLVFAAAPDHVGPVELGVVVLDDLGQESAAASLTLSFYRAGERGLGAMHVFAERGADVVSLDLREYAVAGDEELRLIGCGAAVHGTVVCSPDGTALYHPTASAGADQFSFHLYSEAGEQATGSVTLVGSAAELPTTGLVPSRADDDMTSALVPRLPPPDGAAEETPGMFDAFVRLLDRVGA